MRISRALVAVLASMALSVTACGGDDDSDGGGDSTSPDASSDAGGAADGAAEEIDICGALSAEEVGAALGGTVSQAEIPGGGCSFSQEDPRAPSASVIPLPSVAGNGGFEGAKAGVTASIEGDVEELDGVGDEAFFVVGPSFGGDSEQASGAVRFGETAVQVVVSQGQELSEDDVRTLAVDVLTLVGSKG